MSNSEKMLNRRNFIKGGVAAGVLAATAGLSACGSKTSQTTEAAATQTSGKTASTSSGFDENGICTMSRAEYFESQKPEIGEIANSEDFDIVVIGAGNGGLPAAVSAMDLGASVIVVEATSGYTTWAGEIGAWNSKVEQDEWGVPHRSDEELQNVVNDMCRYASYGIDQRLVETYIFNSGRTMDWVCDKMAAKGIKFHVETDMKDTLYQTLPSQHCAYVDGTWTELGPNQFGSQIANPAWLEMLDEGGAEVRFNTSAKIFVQDDSGKVTGVVVENEDGTFTQLNASKAVVLSTGGYAGNVEMMDVLGVNHHREAVNNLGCQGRMGDGIKMAVWAGADMDRDCANSIMSFDRGACALDHHVGPEYGNAMADIYWPGSQPFLKVNTLGERFVNEDGPYDFQSSAAMIQPGHIWFQIFDSNYWDDVQRFHTTICSRVVAVPGGQNSEVLPGVYPVTNGEDYHSVFMQPGLDSGRLIEADTLEDLANQLGLPVDAFLATVERYNELYDAGADSDFGKVAFRLSSIKNGPFYGIALGSWMLCSLAGIRINTNMQAIKEDGSPIGGLYITGNDVGGFFKNSYPEFYAGTAHGRTTCFARLATLHAMTGSIYE